MCVDSYSDEQTTMEAYVQHPFVVDILVGMLKYINFTLRFNMMLSNCMSAVLSLGGSARCLCAL